MTGLVSRSSALCAATDADALTDLGRTILDLSTQQWGRDRATVMIGRDSVMADAQYRLLQFAQTSSPILYTGETGTGKELFARAATLLSPRRDRPYLSVNCAQYQGENLAASELFGHRRGSFTGAVQDHRGVFEAADGGVLFLDEIGELTLGAQALLLRTLSDGEIVPVGESRARRVDVRLVAATNRDLKSLVAAGGFRADLFYRLRCLQVALPPLRERGRDWEWLLRDALATLNAARGTRTRLAPATLAMLEPYGWPGNVRELRAVVETGFHESETGVIEPRHIAEALEDAARGAQLRKVPLVDAHPKPPVAAPLATRSFWDEVGDPFLARDLNRREVQSILATALAQSGGSYKRALGALGIPQADYLRFMDFLRHHRLKPDEFRHPRVSAIGAS
jgi:transcriptional regulator with GAF, ATPase, and Fis domain